MLVQFLLLLPRTRNRLFVLLRKTANSGILLLQVELLNLCTLQKETFNLTRTLVHLLLSSGNNNAYGVSLLHPSRHHVTAPLKLPCENGDETCPCVPLHLVPREKLL